LMWAAAANRVAAMQVLIAKGADVKAVSNIENIPEREKTDRAALALRNRRVAALKAAEQPVLMAPEGGRGGRGGAGAGAPAVGGGRGEPAMPGAEQRTERQAATPAPRRDSAAVP